MIIRKQLDVRWHDFAYGLLACAGLAPRPTDRDPAGRTVLSARPDALVCLSVRSGFDLLLAEFAWPHDDEVLVTAITIPDMGRILREHGLKAVPVDLDPATLMPEEAALERAVTPRTRAILVAHLFGARLPLERLVAWAHARGLLVLEDCAQAYTADGFEGHAGSDVRMFSFGTIKTATAFGAGVLLVGDPALRARLAARHARWPVQRAAAYAKRLLKYGAFFAIQSPGIYGLIFRLIRLGGGVPDQVVMDYSRGFSGGDFFPRLRQQPSAALRRMLAHRLATYDPARVEHRAQAGEFLLGQLRTVQPLGARAERRTHWLFPLSVGNPAALLPLLEQAGFDATRASSSLYAVPASAGRDAPAARAAIGNVVYVPADAAMGRRQLTRLAGLLNAHAEPVASAAPPPARPGG
jgi:dTDP-4-amino-4,6-dideoxygalactose transaminase